MRGEVLGDSASEGAQARLRHHLAAIKAANLRGLLSAALSDLRAGRRAAAASGAGRAIDVDADCGLAWHILAICHEQDGDVTAALGAYERALALTPGEPEITSDLGRLALKMGLPEIAEQLLSLYVAGKPDALEGLNNLACAQRDLMRFDAAVETLRGAIAANPQSALLWNCLAGVLTLQGRITEALTFFDEAVRLAPDYGAARYNRALARMASGDGDGARQDLDAAEPLVDSPIERAGVKMAQAHALLGAGRLGEGWDAYEARFDPHYDDFTLYAVDLPPLAPDRALAGLRLLLIGEQGVGDEVLFANLLPDLLQAVGPNGRLALAVDARLIDLFQRSFPTIEVVSHASGRVDHISVRTARLSLDGFDAYAPLGSLNRRLRRDLDCFRPGAFLVPEAAAVARWRGLLDALPGRKVGVLWKSLVMDAARIRHFAPFATWREVLRTPGVTFVNLQYGDSAREAAIARDWGVDLWTPPGIDRKDDLDAVAALTSALDLTIGPANAATNIAGACGAPLWLISTPHAWPRLGQDDYPWYRQARVFTPPSYSQWPEAMAALAGALAAWTTP